MKKLVIVAALFALTVSGCATKAQTGALVGTGVGAAVGAGLGQAIGRNTSATLIGAAAGAVAGGLVGTAIGNYMDKQEADMRQALANAEAASIQRERQVLDEASRRDVDVLTVTFKSDYLFAVNSSSLLPGAYDEVNRVAQVLNQYPQTTIVISGHTDSTGSEQYNQALSERRANAVKNALVGMGVNPARMTTIGFGKSKPVASNASEAGRQLNRRVELRIVPQQQQ
ncbi:MAG TPA: OmpA family protein [Geobacteraceae bacterium]|nr:OmpA family protein [Geobacteraceae bacterium]